MELAASLYARDVAGMLLYLYSYVTYHEYGESSQERIELGVIINAELRV